MKKLMVITNSERANGFQIAGINAIGSDDINTVINLITSLLDKKEEILLALDDNYFSQLGQKLISRIYNSEEMLFVTIPDNPLSEADAFRKKKIFEMIRHATGVQIRFKGETNVTK